MVTPPRKNVPSGPDKSVPPPRSLWKSLLLKLIVKRNLVNSVVLAVVSPNLVRKNALIRRRPLSKRSLKKLATLSLKSPANSSPNLYLIWSQLKSVWIFPRKSAPDPDLTQDRCKSLWSRSGATFPPRNLAWLKKEVFLISNQVC